MDSGCGVAGQRGAVAAHRRHAVGVMRLQGVAAKAMRCKRWWSRLAHGSQLVAWRRRGGGAGANNKSRSS